MQTIVDTQTLEMLQAALGEELRELVDELFKDVPIKLQEMKAHCAQGDGDALAKTAHVIKGSSGNLGASALAEACAQLEAAAGEGDVSRWEPIIAQVEAQFDKTKEVMTDYLGG